MPTVGIVTGISHQTGADYYIKINEKIQNGIKWKYAGNTSKLVMYSVNLEEYVAYLTANRLDLVIDLLADAAVCVHKAGADFLVIASNTGHMAIPRIRKLIPKLPILHIADCCAQVILSYGYFTTGLVGTCFTMQHNYLINRLKQHGLKVVVPLNKSDQNEMERIIEKELSSGIFLDKTKNWFVNVIKNDLVKKQGAQCCILGCTEIELLLKQNDIPNIKLINSAQQHINSIVDIQLGKKSISHYYPKNYSKL